MRIEHVGSTSVSGLAAKPIVDVQVSAADLDDEAPTCRRSKRSGCSCAAATSCTATSGRSAAHRVTSTSTSTSATSDPPWKREHLLFRDYLREHAEARDAYSRAKRAAAARWADDGFAYTDAKTEVILQILAATA